MPNNSKYKLKIGTRTSLWLAMLNAIITTEGATITQAGHSGRLQSCSIVNKMTIAKGKVVMQSSIPPIS